MFEDGWVSVLSAYMVPPSPTHPHPFTLTHQPSLSSIHIHTHTHPSTVKTNKPRDENRAKIGDLPFRFVVRFIAIQLLKLSIFTDFCQFSEKNRDYSTVFS